MFHTKDLLTHEILNLLTIMNLSIMESGLEKDKKEYLLERIKLSNLLIGFEKLFLGEKLEQCPQQFSLKEPIEMIRAVYEEKIQEKGITLTNINSGEKITIDRYYFTEALTQLLLKIFETATKIDCMYDEKKRLFTIGHNGRDMSLIKKRKPIDCLRRENIQNQEVSFYLAFSIFSELGIKVVFTKNAVILTLPLDKNYSTI